ncbi:uncharacterized protein TRIADDRAFT_12445, partial [Trichoplax adhaerens]
NVEAWETGHILQLDNKQFIVQVNPPRIVSLQFPDTDVFVGFTIAPNVKMEFSSVQQSHYEWFSSRQKNGKQSWEKVGDNIHYKIQPSDFGQRLKLRCTPRHEDNYGDAVTIQSNIPVSYGPIRCLSRQRYQFTQSKLDVVGDLRIVSYNILSSGYSNDVFRYCNPRYLRYSYRLPLIIDELVGYNADIICLQECDKELLQNVILPAMRTHGYSGNHIFKKAEVKEGLALLYNRSKFQLLSLHTFALRDLLLKDESLGHLAKQIKKHPQLKRKCVNLPNVAMACVFRWREAPNKLFCIGNTHLYANPMLPEVRLVQASVVLHQLNLIRNKFTDVLPILLCGDFNSIPNSNVYQLLTTHQKHQKHFFPTTADRWKPIDLVLDNAFDFYSLCGIPQFTNYVQDFVGTLDYIFGEKEYVDVKQVVPFPTEDEIKRDKALPSPNAPSDHLALVCDV